jgi:hypothetical protein
MTPTNPAAPPAAPVLEHPAMVARRVSVPGVSYDEGGRMIEAYAQARVDAATRELRQALHDAVMNLPRDDRLTDELGSGYAYGHRDARHAAAELILSHERTDLR